MFRKNRVQHNSNNIPGVMNNSLRSHHAASLRMTQYLPHHKCVVLFMKLFSFLLIFFFFVIPALILIYPGIIAEVTYLNRFGSSPSNLDRPTEFGLSYARNLRLDAADGITLGAWHILPEELARDVANSDGASDGYLNTLTAGNPIILYLHGNGGSRAYDYRVDMYKVLSRSGFHVVTFDYRGFGDSTGSPSEEGLVQDSISVFKWLRQRAADAPIYIWGHSLGSAVATQTANRLCKEGAVFSGLILEAPFNNFIEAAGRNPLSWPCCYLPWFSWVLSSAAKSNNIRLASDEHITGVTGRIMILHAVDDPIIPYDLALKLRDAAIRRPEAFGSNKVEMVTFDSGHGYGHEYLYKSPKFVDVVRKFTLEQIVL